MTVGHQGMHTSVEDSVGVVVWPVVAFGELYGRCRPKQKLTSPDSDPMTLQLSEGRTFKIVARLILFPKGLQNEDSPAMGGVLFQAVDLEENATVAISFSVQLKVQDGVDVTDSAECVVGGGGQFTMPTSVELGSLGSISVDSSVQVTLRCWRKSDDLFGDVRFGFSSIASSMYGLVSQSPVSSRPAAVEEICAPSPLDNLASVILDVAEGYTVEEWAVVVHICSAVVAATEGPKPSVVSTLSDETRGRLFALCPPLRVHYQELAHTPSLQGELIRRLVDAVQGFGGLESPKSRLAALQSLVDRAGRVDGLEEMETIYRFMLDPTSISVGDPSIKCQIAKLIDDLKACLMAYDDVAVCHAQVEEHLARAEALEREAMTSSQSLRERVRYIAEYAGWGLHATAGLRRALAYETESPIAPIVVSGRELLSIMSS